MNQFNLIILALLAVSEVLALIPAVGSNSIFQLIVNLLRSIGPKFRALIGGKEEAKDDEKTTKSKK